MATKKRSNSTKSRTKKMPQRGCLLTGCLLWLMLGGLLGVLTCVAGYMLLVFPHWKALKAIPNLDFILGLATLGIGAVAMLQFLFAYGLWRWRRWGFYGLLVMETSGIAFSVLSLLQHQIANPAFHKAIAALSDAARGSLSALLPIIILWFLLRPYWTKMKG